MSELVKFLSLSHPFELRSDHFPSHLHLPEGINEDPSVWLDEDRTPAKYMFKNNTSWMNSKS